MTHPIVAVAARDPAQAPTGQSREARRRAAFWLLWGHYVGLVGIALSNGLLALSVLVAPWRRDGGRLAHPAFQPLLIALGAYAIVLLAAIGASFDPRVSLREATELYTLLTVVLALLLVRSEREAQWMVDGVVLLATVQSVVGFVQLLDLGGADLSRRIHGLVSHYMTFAGLLLMANLLLLAEIACGRKERRWRWWALVPINAMLLASLTRSAWVGVAVGVVVLLLVSRRRRYLLLLPVLALFVVALAPQGAVLERARSIVDLEDPTNYDRLCMAYAGIRMIQERPALGHGPRAVRELYPIYRHPTAPRIWVPHLHNSFLQSAAERGLLGLGAYLGLMGVGIWRAVSGFRRWRRRGPRGARSGPAAIYLGAAAALVGFNAAGLFEGNWGDTEVQRLALLALALPFCLDAAEDEP
jgi:O-antigen ligase